MHATNKKLPTSYLVLPTLRSDGFSLVELLIAMTLGLMLTAGTFTIFSGNKRSASLNREMASMQESARFALNAISEDIRMAGYQGCADINKSSVSVIANDSPSEDFQSTMISGSVIGFFRNWNPDPELGSGDDEFEPPQDITPRRYTHTLAMQFAKNPGSSVTGVQTVGSTPNSTGPLVLSRPIEVDVGDLALVSTCETGDIFRVTGKSVSASNGTMTLEHGDSQNARPSFQQIYGMPFNIGQTRVMPFTTRVYFIADTGEEKPDSSPLYALYQQTSPFDEDTNPPVMLVEGVENMRVLFGVGDNDGNLQYVTADDSDYEPSKIRSVRVGLLMSSYGPLRDSEDTNTYVLAGTSIEASDIFDTAQYYSNDMRFRLAFNTTETVRNRRVSQ